MMREWRFGGDNRTRSPPRVSSQGGRDYSPPRQSRYLRNLSPTRANMKVLDYPHDLRIRSPPRVSMQSWETRDYQRHNHSSPEIHSHLCSEREKQSDYSLYLDEDRDRQLQNLSQFNDGLPQRDSPSTNFQWRHLFEKTKRMNDDENINAMHYSDYGINSTRVTTERSYQSSGSADMGCSGTRVKELMPLEVEQDKTVPASYPIERGARKGYEIDGGGLLLQSQNLNMGLQKSENFRFQSQMPSDKVPARDLHKGEKISEFYYREEDHPFYSGDTSRYMIPSSQSKPSSIVTMGCLMDDFRDSHSDGFHVRSDGFIRSTGMLTEPIPREAHTHILQMKSSRDSILQLDMTKQRQVQHSPSDGSHGGYTYYEARRSEKSEMPALSNPSYLKPGSVEGDYGFPDSFGSRIVKPIKDRIVVTEGSHREHMIEGPLWDQYYSKQEQSIDSYLDSVGSSYASRKDAEAFGDISMHHEYEREVYGDHGNTYMRENHGSGRAYLQPEDEISNMLLMKEYHQDMDGVYHTYQEGFPEEELYLVEQPKRVIKRKHHVKKELSSWNPRNRLSSDNEIHHGTSSGLLMNASRCRKLGRRTIKDVGCRNSNFVAHGGPSVRIGKSNVRDIKKRLGSTLKDIKKRLGPLRPVSEHNHIAHPSVKKRKEKSRRNQDACRGSIHGEEEESPLEGGLPLAKSEPHVESEEFKQLVHSVFLKFVKQLNENPAQCRRLKGQEKAGSLKCSVCGRDSEEFLDTQSLALHAFTAVKVGMGAQHLGFHKAVCFLMGWKSADVMNSEWVFQLLPDAETVALKEDLIIWPPLVVIHNSSLGNDNPDKRVIVPVEMLEGMLRDMGFGQKTKVCFGNHGVMVVKFCGTFSGFQEAEKLHKIYADSKHGRSEFQSIIINPDDIQKLGSANKVEEFLYGYLGIAEDLDKLDFETKKRCLLRSKKEIQKIADALLKN